MGITICHRRKFGQVWGSPASLSEVMWKLCCRKTPLWTFNYHMEKSESFCDVTRGLYTLVTRRYVLGVLYGENRPKSENWATLTPCSSATVRRREKLTKIRNSLAFGMQRGVNNISLYCSAWVQVLVWSIFDFRLRGQMTPKVKSFESIFSDSATGHRTTFRDQIWWKSAVAKLPKGPH